MSDRSDDRPEERRRTGPLGDPGDAGETRREPPADAGSDPGATRQVPNRPTGDQSDARETEAVPRRSSGETDDKETRVIRTPPRRAAGGDTAEASPYPRGYFEAADEREDRLRDMYGGVDWLASFLGFVFVAVVGTLFSLISGLVLAPLGFSLDLSGGDFGAAVITGLVLVAVLIFLAYFFGGYVAGRLARFDGGRNGAMLLLWTFIAVALLVLAGGVFGGFLRSRTTCYLRSAASQGLGSWALWWRRVLCWRRCSGACSADGSGAATTPRSTGRPERLLDRIRPLENVLPVV
jgi:hypothetical protein